MSLKRSIFSSIIPFFLILGTLPLAAQKLNMRCGIAGSYTASDGSVWQGDQYFVGGQQLYTGYPVSGTPDTTLYQYARNGLYGDINYSIPLTNGSYQVTLKFAEIQFWAPGQRVFNVSLNGTQVLSNFDIVAQAGAWTAIDKQFPVTVTNGTLAINFHGVTNYGLVNAIQIAPTAAPPVVSLSTNTLSFSATSGGTNPASQTVNITNTGSGTLNWTATKAQSWLTISPTAGTAPSSLSVSANIAGLAVGTYNDTITVSGGGSSQNITVTAVVSAAVVPPTLTVSPGSFTFAGTVNGANPSAQSLNIGNSGGGTLAWSASRTQSWLTVSPSSGTGPGAAAVSVSTAGLAAGTYNDTITVSATGATSSPQQVSVQLVVSAAGPTITVSPGTLSFSATVGGSNPVNQSLSISNTGGGTLNWNASKTTSWLTLSGTGGTAPSTLIIGAVSSGLAAGTYNDTITISANGATNSPQTVGVTLVVGSAAPILTISSKTAAFTATAGGSNPATQNISISNTGGGTLNWTATKSSSWLSLSAPSGTAPSTLGLTVSISGLAAGTYNDTVTISSSGATGSPQTVAVTLTVAAAAPVLTVSSNTAAFTATAGGSNPATQNINISNTGGGTLNWTATKSSSWLSLSAPSGTAPSTLGLTVSISGLAAGTYNDTVTISSSGATGSPQTVAVTLTVAAAAPVLTVSSNTAAFTATAGGSNPATQNINISNTGGGTLNWTATKSSSWLSLSAPSGTAPSTLGLTVSTSGLAAGTYNDTVTISSSGATGSPQTVAVTLTVGAAAPVLTVSSNTAAFTATAGGSNPATQNISISNTGGGTLNWTATKSSSWLSLSAPSGTAPSTLGLTVSTSGLAAGTYNDTVTISSSGATGSPQTVAVTLVVSPASSSNTASFVRLDTTTQGTWINNYGTDGYSIEAVTPSLPAYAQVTVNGAQTYVWSAPTTDVRALQQPSGNSRIASTWFATSSFSIDVNLTDGGQHQVTLYSLDYDNAGRAQRVDILDATSGATLDTRQMTGFGSGEYVAWNITGHVTIKMTLLTGTNPVVSGLFFDTAGKTPTSTAAFVKLDTTTQGSWINTYGTDGNDIASLTATIPAYAKVAVNGPSTFVWSGSLSDPRALQTPGGATRIASTWYGSSFNFDVNFTDGNNHQLALYAMDYDNSSRSERIDVADAATGVVLDSRTLGSFVNGQYLVWNLQGHLIIRVTALSGNAVVSGLFFEPSPISAVPILSLSTTTVTLTGISGAANSTTSSVAISNNGGGTLNWTASGTQSWLTLSATSGVAPATLTIGASTASLGAGSYTDTVTVNASSATGSPKLVTVNLTLTAPPSLSVSSNALSFTGVSGGAAPASQSINIGNSGGGTLTWSATKSSSWLTLSQTSGTGAATLGLSVSTTGLAVGSYSDTVVITAPGAKTSPQSVTVSLVVSAPVPTLGVSSNAVSFSAVAGGTNPAAQSITISNNGGGTVTWSATNSRAWLTLSASSGTAPSTLALNVSVTGLSAGTYTDTVVISGGTAANSPQNIAVTLVISSATASAASFIKLDTTTQGSWINTYGSNGYDFIGAAASLPTYAQMTVKNAFIYSWTASSSDARALQVPNGGSRVAATWYASGSFSVDLNLTDGQTHQISLYAVDFDTAGRAERVDIMDAASGTLLDSRTLSSFSAGQWPVWNISGHVTINITQLTGPNAVLNGVFFDNAGAAPVSSTLFERLDTTTLGSWENGYGGDGYQIVGLSSALPAYAQVTVGGGAQTFVWNGGTTDSRALQIPSSLYRIASTWYAPKSLSFDINLTDGNVHRIAIYALDFDNGGRTEQVSVLDSQTGVTLDSRTIGPFTQGEYLVWNLAGHIIIQVTNLGGTNAVVSGIFFGRSPLVTTPMTLSLSTSILTLAGVVGGSNPSPQGVTITNSGIGTLNWTATANQPWLTLSSGSGTAPSLLSIGANLSGLQAGSYTGTVGIAAPGALGTPQAITVNLNVRGQPAILSISQNGLTFATPTAGVNPAGQSVVISNAGTGALTWTAAATHSWVTLSALSGTAPSTLNIGVNTAGLTSGVYTDTVVITGAGASSSPQSVTVTLVIGAANGQHYVSPQGTPTGDGSINNPWDLQTALFQPATVMPGDTIWIRGGTYGNGQGIFYSRLVGTAQLPIVVRQFPGERATIDGWLQVGCCDQAPNSAMGQYVWFWGLEFASSVTNRTGLPNGQSSVLDAVDTWAPGTKFINNIVHDARVGISMWKEAVGAEAYGNVVYFNGFQASDRGHGHGFYVQNISPTMNVTNNIVFDQFDNGLQFYGSSAAQVKNITAQGNISFNNGILSTGSQMADGVIFVNTNGLSGIQLLNNHFYFTPQLGLGYNEMGWPGPNQDLVITGNYFVGGFESLAITDWATVTFQNNTIYSNNFSLNFTAGATPSGYTWDNNTYYGSGLFGYNGQSTTLGGWQGWTGWDSHSTGNPNAPTGVWSFVEPNKYEPNRANIVIYNWNLAPTVSVDVSSAVAVGTRYQILDAENYYGAPVATGTYTGGTITIPMTGLTIATPNGAVPTTPSHTAPQFGAFVLLPLQ